MANKTVNFSLLRSDAQKIVRSRLILAIVREAEFIPNSLPGVAITKYHTLGGWLQTADFILS